MICDAIREQLSLYAGGDLPAAEADAVAEHLEACADCRRQVAELKESLALLGLAAADAVYPSARLPRVRWTRHPAWRVAIAVALVGAMLIGSQVPAVVALGADVMGWVRTLGENLTVREMTTAEADAFQQPVKPDPPEMIEADQTNNSTISRTMPLDEIEAQVDYNILKPTYLPEGFHFERSQMMPYNQDVYLEYSGPAGWVIFKQSSPDTESRWSVAAPDVEIVQVGNREGALTRSVIRLELPDGAGVWEQPRISLHVQLENHRVISITWSEPDFPVAEMVKLAESLYAPPEEVAQEPVQTCFATKPDKKSGLAGRAFESTPLSEIEAETGWTVLLPTYLPDGYAFDSSVLHPLRPEVSLVYNGPLGRLLIGQEEVDGGSAPEIDAPVCAQEQIKIGDLNAVLVKGGWLQQPDGSWSWVEGPGQWLEFTQDGKRIAVVGFPFNDYSRPGKPKVKGPVSRDEMIKVAESLR